MSMLWGLPAGMLSWAKAEPPKATASANEPSIETIDLRDMIIMSYLQNQVARRNSARLRPKMCREVEY
ncbi:MAG: hypothetical protein ABIQ36_02710, partial [Rhodanobacter sp.]